MEVSKQIIHISSQAQYRKALRQYKHLEVLAETHWDSEDGYHAIIKAEPYHPEEIEERMMYGDPDHERYLMSDEYEADCREEQYDWIKREMQ